MTHGAEPPQIHFSVTYAALLLSFPGARAPELDPRVRASPPSAALSWDSIPAHYLLFTLHSLVRRNLRLFEEADVHYLDRWKPSLFVIYISVYPRTNAAHHLPSQNQAVSIHEKKEVMMRLLRP